MLIKASQKRILQRSTGSRRTSSRKIQFGSSCSLIWHGELELVLCFELQFVLLELQFLLAEF